MSEYTLKEVTYEEYKAELNKTLTEKGLKQAVSDICDKINSITSLLSYCNHRDVQELMCDILCLIDLSFEDIKAEIEAMYGVTDSRTRRLMIDKYEVLDLFDRKVNEVKDGQ